MTTRARVARLEAQATRAGLHLPTRLYGAPGALLRAAIRWDDADHVAGYLADVETVWSAATMPPHWLSGFATRMLAEHHAKGTARRLDLALPRPGETCTSWRARVDAASARGDVLQLTTDTVHKLSDRDPCPEYVDRAASWAGTDTPGAPDGLDRQIRARLRDPQLSEAVLAAITALEPPHPVIPDVIANDPDASARYLAAVRVLTDDLHAQADAEKAGIYRDTPPETSQAARDAWAVLQLVEPAAS